MALGVYDSRREWESSLAAIFPIQIASRLVRRERRTAPDSNRVYSCAMSFLALVTNRFDDVVRFYGDTLGLPVLDAWDRETARGLRFDAGGMRIEVIDNQRERQPRNLGDCADRVHVVIEVDDIDAARAKLGEYAPAIEETRWGARLFEIRDPDGIPVSFLQWTGAD